MEHLQKGELVVPMCTSCGKRAWPPSPHCPSCLHPTRPETVNPHGVLVEFSHSHVRNHEGAFGIIDMADGFRLVGSFLGDGGNGAKLEKGMRVKMVGCGVRPDGAPFYEFAPLDNEKEEKR